MRMRIASAPAHGTSNLIRRVSNLVETAEQAWPIGLLDVAELDAAVRLAYAQAPDFYDPARYRIDYECRLLPAIAELVDGTQLLDLYCGQGREARIFAEAGYDVLGVDASAHAIEQARNAFAELGLGTRFEHADIDTWVPHDTFDVVYTSLWMYSTVANPDRRLAWLVRLGDWVKPGGVLIVSTTPLLDARGAARRHFIAKLLARASLNRRSPEYGDRFDRELFWHDFEVEAAVAEFRAAGYSVVQDLRIPAPTPCDFYVLQRHPDP